jgi:hypothetical protein
MVEVWTGFISLRIETNEGYCEHGNERSGSVKHWELSCHWLLKKDSVPSNLFRYSLSNDVLLKMCAAGGINVPRIKTESSTVYGLSSYHKELE